MCISQVDADFTWTSVDFIRNDMVVMGGLHAALEDTKLEHLINLISVFIIY